MSKRILNLIIFLSITGILIITARDYLLSQKTKNKVKNKPSPTITQGIPPSKPKEVNPQVPCQNRFFNFKKGTTWRYKLILEMKENGKKQQMLNTFFTNKIIEASSSSVIIESQLKGEKITNQLSCRKDGIYGLPFPLLPTSFLKNLSPLPLKVDLTNQSILLLPSEEKLKKGKNWSTISLPEPGFSLNNEIVKETREHVFNLKNVKVLTVQSKVKTNSPLLKLIDLNNQSINYQLGENIGFLNLYLDLSLSTLNKIKLTLNLVEFKTNL